LDYKKNMKKIVLFSALLFMGLVGSQVFPLILGNSWHIYSEVLGFFTMVGLSFIMIHVGYEFELDKTRLKSYGWDYIVAMTAAGFPWIFATLYFIYILLPPENWSSWDAWKEALLAGRFAAPTATGVLFSMLAAAGLSASWMFRKVQILVIFDDLDTVLLMIPIKIIMVGIAWQMGIMMFIMVILLWIAWRWLHRINIPVGWNWVLAYSVLIAGVSEAIYWGTKVVDERIPIHIEVLLPAFVLGCIMKRLAGTDPHADDEKEGHQEGPESPAEQKVSAIVSASFMALVGLSMPLFINTGAETASILSVTGRLQPLTAGALILHVLILTVLINLGKMFPAVCYRREAHWKERFALALGMCPRGEVGAGIILLSLEYGIGGPVVTVAVLSLALNLLLTPVFVYFINKLIRSSEKE
jgi:Kef-type K+ transport system membrane component KefB